MLESCPFKLDQNLLSLREDEMKQVLEYDSFAGNHITDVASGALDLAMKEKKPVHFEFNGIDVLVEPTDSRDGVLKRWEIDMEASNKAYREHPDRITEAAERARKDKEEREAKMIDTSANETEMRNSEVPWPKTEKQLLEYIKSLTERTHDYGTCVYAMSMAATATFNYVAGQLGVTGFQSSCADMDILRRTRSIKGPFMILKGEDALYPQYDLPGKLEKALEEWKPWLAEEAEKNLADKNHAHHDVITHWKKLAKNKVKSEVKV